MLKKTTKYHIKKLFWLLKDEKSVRFHIDNNDYFGTIATILNLLKQTINKSELEPHFWTILNNVEKDLLWLQNNYQITPKIKNKNKIPNGKDSSQ